MLFTSQQCDRDGKRIILMAEVINTATIQNFTHVILLCFAKRHFSKFFFAWNTALYFSLITK